LKAGVATLNSVSSTNHLNEVLNSALVSEQTTGEAEVLHASIKAGTVAQMVVATIAVIGIVYLLKLVLVTVLASMLLAYILEPMVSRLKTYRVPRWVGALIAVLLTLTFAVGLSYFSYRRAREFIDEFPTYTSKIVGMVASIGEQADKNEGGGTSAQNGKSVALAVREQAAVSRFISENGTTILDVLLAVGFIPFLVYFMLTWKDHSHLATVQLFPREHRLLAHRTVGTISTMIRTFIIANVTVGLLNSVVCALVFWIVGIKYFYFVGAISGFISLVPYFGTFLALLPPLAGGIDTLDKTGVGVVLVTVVGVHVLTVNVIYPRFIGKRLKINPLAVSLSLLFWAWIWGAPGLVFAIPLLGAAKIICDHIDPLRGLGSWLGESARPTPT
jgi:predicted PurR-regulated permease PerM